MIEPVRNSDEFLLHRKPSGFACANTKRNYFEFKRRNYFEFKSKEEKSSSVDTNWLFRRLLHYLEFEMKVEEKERFANMKGGDFAHALMMVYGAYLINASETGKKVIVDD